MNLIIIINIVIVWFKELFQQKLINNIFRIKSLNSKRIIISCKLIMSILIRLVKMVG